MHKALAVLVLFLVSVFAIHLRVGSSAHRLAHADEGEQALSYIKLYQTNTYKYSPEGAHGSILYYWAYFVKKTQSLFGEPSHEISSLRLTLLPIFLLSILAFFAIKSQVDFGLIIFAIIAWSISALSILYSIYFIQEIFFSLFVFLAMCYLYFSIIRQKTSDFIIFGLACGFAQSSKENFIIALFAIFVPALFLAYKNKLELNANLAKKLCLSFISALLVYIIFYSSFGANPRGIIDGALSYLHFFDKAQSDVHSKEFLYYAKILFWQKSQGVYFGEFAITIFALLGALLGYLKKDKLINYVSAFCLMYFLVMSLIPYKTPWLLLSLIMPMCVLFGYAFSLGFRHKNNIIKLATLIALMLVLFFKCKSNSLATKRFAMDSRNPFIYVHTQSDLKNFLARIDDIKGRYPEIEINFEMQNSPFPIPYYLMKYKNITYNNAPQKSHILVTDSPIENSENYQEEFYGLRENLLIYLYIEKNTFKEILK